MEGKNEEIKNGVDRHGTEDHATKRVKVSESNEVSKTTKAGQAKEYGGFECPVTDILHTSYVKSMQDLDNLRELKVYKAEYPENLFQTETVKGLKNPKVRLYFSPLRLRVYVHFEADKKAPNFDDLEEKIIEHFTVEDADPVCTTSLQEFKSWVEEETQSFDHEGKLILKFHSPHDRKFEIRKFNQCEEKFLKQYNAPYQTYLYLDIDNSSMIEDDPYWDYYLLLEVTGESRRLAGFVTAYKSYQSLTRFRMRISQFTILPEYQKQGLAAKLYSTVYQKFLEKAE